MLRRRLLGLACLAVLVGGVAAGCNGGQAEIPLAKVPLAPSDFADRKNVKDTKRPSGLSPSVLPVYR